LRSHGRWDRDSKAMTIYYFGKKERLNSIILKDAYIIRVKGHVYVSPETLLLSILALRLGSILVCPAATSLLLIWRTRSHNLELLSLYTVD
jgi:hypothetical protein